MHIPRGALAAFIPLALLGLAFSTIAVWVRGENVPQVDSAADPLDSLADGVPPAPQAAPERLFPERTAASSPPPQTGTTVSDPAGRAIDGPRRECSRILGAAEDFAMKEALAAYPARDEDEPIDLLGGLVRNTSGLRDPSYLLAALLLDRPEKRVASDPSAHTALVDVGARAADSDSPLLAWHALRACVEAGQFCPFTHLERPFLEVERDNAEAWALVATLDYRRGDVAGALAAMQGAARAPTSTWHWTETFATLERSLAAQTTASYPERLFTAMNAMASAGLPALRELQAMLAMCSTESPRSRAWGEACLAFGTVRSETNETLAGRDAGYAILGATFKALGETERAEQVAAERAAAGPVGSGALEGVLLTADPARLDAYLAAVREHGEAAGARAFLRAELPPLLERAGLLGRAETSDCLAGFLQ